MACAALKGARIQRQITQSVSVLRREAAKSSQVYLQRGDSSHTQQLTSVDDVDGDGNGTDSRSRRIVHAF